MPVLLRQSLSLAARFLRASGGSTSIEYAVIGALVACGIIVGATAVGIKLNIIYGGFAGDVPDVN